MPRPRAQQRGKHGPAVIFQSARNIPGLLRPTTGALRRGGVSGYASSGRTQCRFDNHGGVRLCEGMYLIGGPPQNYGKA